MGIRGNMDKLLPCVLCPTSPGAPCRRVEVTASLGGSAASQKHTEVWPGSSCEDVGSPRARTHGHTRAQLSQWGAGGDVQKQTLPLS